MNLFPPKDLFLLKRKFCILRTNALKKVLDLNVSTKANNLKYQLVSRDFFTKEFVAKFGLWSSKKVFLLLFMSKEQAS